MWWAVMSCTTRKAERLLFSLMNGTRKRSTINDSVVNGWLRSWLTLVPIHIILGFSSTAEVLKRLQRKRGFSQRQRLWMLSSQMTSENTPSFPSCSHHRYPLSLLMRMATTCWYMDLRLGQAYLLIQPWPKTSAWPSLWIEMRGRRLWYLKSSTQLQAMKNSIPRKARTSKWSDYRTPMFWKLRSWSWQTKDSNWCSLNFRKQEDLEPLETHAASCSERQDIQK